MNQLENYIQYYDDVISEGACEELIALYDAVVDPIKSYRKWEEDYRDFHEINITRRPQFSKYVNSIYAVAESVYTRYKLTAGRFFPEKMGFEELRMKKYEANDNDQFGWHVDVGNYNSACRYLVMFFYLNDVESGGETQFEFAKDYKSSVHFTIKPKRGRIVVFPPMWMFPHKGCKPISGPKYILSTYAHYQ